MEIVKFDSKEIDLTLNNIIQDNFGEHPFSSIPSSSNYEEIMRNYFAMSQAFPYLQAGSQKDLFFHYMANNEDIPLDVELTTIVGNFLCWDETGGFYPTIAMGVKALPRILETERFHYNLLRDDCFKLFNKKIQPNYSSTTKAYLLNLYQRLSSKCPLTRLAAMVSFEYHANNMITALWNSLTSKFDIAKDKLRYFLMHVGGSQPAEEFHVGMTMKLISKIVKQEEFDNFIEKFTDGYSLNYTWCKDVIALGNPI